MILIGVFGNPVEHSRSPEIHQAFAAQVGIQIDYQKILVPLAEFKATADAFLARGARGFNITVPFKNEAFQYCSTHALDASIAKAVNTIVKLPDDSLRGHNTDGLGLVNDITKNLKWSLKDQKILVLGAGGAVQGVVGSLLKEAPAQIHIYNRTQSKAQTLVDSFSAQSAAERLVAINKSELLSNYDLIISGTSAGLSGGVGDNLPESIIGDSSRVYDMIYAANLTPFLDWAKKVGACEYVDGLGMLVEQAALAFEIWTDKRVVTADVITRLRNRQ